MTGMITLRKSCLAQYRYEAFCICVIIFTEYVYLQDIHSCLYWLYPIFLMHFREVKLPVHVQVESVVGCSSLPQILTEPEHLKHIDALINLQEQYHAEATQNILCAQTRQKLHYDKKTQHKFYIKGGEQGSIFKVGSRY